MEIWKCLISRVLVWCFCITVKNDLIMIKLWHLTLWMGWKQIYKAFPNLSGKKKEKRKKKKKKAPPNLKFRYAGLAAKIILLKLLSNSLYYQSNWLSIYNWIQSSVILWANNISSDMIIKYIYIYIYIYHRIRWKTGGVFIGWQASLII